MKDAGIFETLEYRARRAALNRRLIDALKESPRLLPPRIWKKIRFDGTHWFFEGYHNKDGYPHVNIDGQPQRLQRVLLRLKPGDPLQANHRCEVRACVNPFHHYLGDQSENVADAMRAGTMQQHHMFGRSNPKARHSFGVVTKARRLREHGWSFREIARHLRVKETTAKGWCSGTRRKAA